MTPSKSDPTCRRRQRGQRVSRAVAVLVLLVSALAGCKRSGSGKGNPPPVPPGSGAAGSPSHTLLADGITFLPPLFRTSEQLRPSLVVIGDELVFSDSSDTPLKKVSLSGGAVTPLAQRMQPPDRIVVHGPRVVWTEGGRLMETVLGPPIRTRLLATGNLEVSPRVLLDDAGAYWVRTVDDSRCSPPCLRRLERVADGETVQLAEPKRQVADLAQDDAYLYWQESQMEPWTPDCDCGSTVRKVPKGGGASTVLVDGRLNGLSLAPVPGHIPGSWFTVGGIATDATHVYFAEGRYPEDRILRVAKSGGSVEPLALVARSTDFDTARTPRRFAVAGQRLYWIDSTSVKSIPVSGGVPATLVDGLAAPVDLVVAGASAFVLERGTAWSRGVIREVPLSGAAATIPKSGLDWPTELALDGSRLYWTEEWRVATAARAGGEVTLLASGIQTHLPRIVALGPDILVADHHILKRVPLAGGAPEKVTVLSCTIPTASSGRVHDLVTDGASVYVTFRAGGPEPSSVCKVSLDGGSGIPHLAQSGPAGPHECVSRVALDAANVYWSSGSGGSLGCAIHRAPRDGGEVTTLFDGPAIDFAVEGGNLYFTGASIVRIDGDGTHSIGVESVNRMSVDGGPVTTWQQPGFPSILAVDAERISWIPIWWMAKDGTASGSWSAGEFDESSLYVDELIGDGTNLYWTNTLLGTIERLDFE